MNERRRMVRFYSLVMVLNIIVAGMFYTVTTPAPIAHAAINVPYTVRPRVKVMSGTPIRLVIPSVGIDVPVDIGTYDPATDSWTLADDRAFYADNSVPANNSNGTTLIYGHARDAMFGPLLNMQVGALALVYSDSGHIFNYRYYVVRDLDPSDTSIFTAAGPPLLSLQTCTGPWDKYRSMYIFQYVGEDKI